MFMLWPVLLLVAQSYSGPPPAKADVPYLLHAGNLISTEVAEVKEKIAGPNSPVKTPLGFPIFIVRVAKLAPEKLQIYAVDTRDDHREINFSQVYTLTVTPIRGDQFRIEVNDSLPNGEYAMTARQSTQAFCFAVY
jgi:hypothetical protein